MVERVKVSNASGKVTVALRLPNNLQLQIYRFVERTEPRADGGSNTVRRAEAVGEPVIIHGYNSTVAKGAPAGMHEAFALTPNIDAAFWSEWCKQFKDHPLLENGLLFASSSVDSVTDQVRDHEDIRTGLEPIEPPPPVMPGEKPKAVADPRIRSLTNNRALMVGSEKA